MAQHCSSHTGHEHDHSPTCGHLHVQWEDKGGYLHDGHLHVEHGDHWDDEAISVSAANPAACAQVACVGHAEQFPQVPHGDHVDRLVSGRLHYRHDSHCDDHGPIQVKA